MARIAHAIDSVETHLTLVGFKFNLRVLRMLSIALKQNENTAANLCDKRVLRMLSIALKL